MVIFSLGDMLSPVILPAFAAQYPVKTLPLNKTIEKQRKKFQTPVSLFGNF